LRQRSQEALRLKAARGDLHTTVAIGYVRGADDRLEMDPDQRIRAALRLVFEKFAEFGSARQVALWLTDEGVELPVGVYGDRGRVVEWRLPRYNTIHRLLTNPVYAGAYVFGRTGSQASVEAGRKRVKRGRRRELEQWEVLIRDHHEGYVSWEDYKRNRRIIAGNANMKGEMVKGSVRNGGGLLAGLLRCGRCGRKLKVLHNGQRGVARYVCNDASINHGRRASCIAFGNMRIDAAVSTELLRVIAPAGLEAALAALAEHGRTNTQVADQKELALEQARYEAARAHRQYDAVDPANRLVASDLERRWNDRLADVARLQEELHIVKKSQPPALSEAERAEIMTLGAELPLLWNHPSASAATRKRILRAVLEEIVVTTEENELRLALHWKGGDHTTLAVPKNRPGQHRWKTSSATEDLLCELARTASDAAIASILNRLGVRTAKNLTWTEQRVRAFRNDHAIAVYREGERAERGEVNLEEAAALLGVSKMTVTRLIKGGVLAAKQSCAGAPYVIAKVDIDPPAIRRAAANTRPISQDPRQLTLEYQ
jgi:excisionase family DNA binding protein